MRYTVEMYVQQKIDENTKLEIIELYKNGESKADLGKKFGIHWTTVGYIVDPELKERKEARKKDWIKNNKERRRQYYLDWYKSELGQKYQAKNKIKLSAHYQVRKAIKSGELIRKACEICGNEKSNGHHEDYSKPLEVVWLCHQHHKARHKLLGNLNFR